MSAQRALKDIDSWQERAACRGIPTDLFFSKFAGYEYPEDFQEAITICSECEVRQECLDYAIKYKEEAGIWGGMTTLQRRAYRREQRQKEWRKKRKEQDQRQAKTGGDK